MTQRRDHTKAGIAFVLACVAIAVVIYVGIKLGRASNVIAPAPANEIVSNYAEADSATDPVDNMVVAQAPSVASDDVSSESEEAPAAWRVLKDEDGTPFLFYGPEGSDNGFNVYCKPDDRAIQLVSNGAGEDVGRNVMVSAAGNQPVRLAATFETEGMPAGFINVPIDIRLWTEIEQGSSPLKIEWSGGYVDELPNHPLLRRLISYCRAHIS